jgi:hypothetical protein
MKIQHNLLDALPNNLRGAATCSFRRISLSCLTQVQPVIRADVKDVLRNVGFVGRNDLNIREVYTPGLARVDGCYRSPGTQGRNFRQPKLQQNFGLILLAALNIQSPVSISILKGSQHVFPRCW